MEKLRFYARGTAQVTDVHAQERGLRRCVGRRWQEVEKGRWAWCPSDKVDEVEYHHDLVKACKDGDLWPADEATAKACGVGFDPNFGSESTETIKDFKAAKADPLKSAEVATPETKKADAKSGKGDV